MSQRGSPPLQCLNERPKAPHPSSLSERSLYAEARSTTASLRQRHDCAGIGRQPAGFTFHVVALD